MQRNAPLAVVVLHINNAAAWAFTAAVSSKETDIGIETNSDYQRLVRSYIRTFAQNSVFPLISAKLYCCNDTPRRGVCDVQSNTLSSFLRRFPQVMLILEGFQAGLTWECILNKRENFRCAFDGFDPEIISRYDSFSCPLIMPTACKYE